MAGLDVRGKNSELRERDDLCVPAAGGLLIIVSHLLYLPLTLQVLALLKISVLISDALVFAYPSGISVPHTPLIRICY